MDSKEKMEIIKPMVDDRVYDYMILENEIRVLTISHPDSESSACALSVDTGSFEDPDEHMLFMGTDRFPDEKDFGEFVTKHAGVKNGYTSPTHSAFYFEIESKSYTDCLERFSRFFISPLLKEDGVERELKAVNSEFEQGRISDALRFNHVLKKLGSATKHPSTKFTCGNRGTLGREDIRDCVKKFFEEKYSSNLMSVVLYGTESTEKLQEYAVKYFSEIKNLKIPKRRYPGSFFYPPTMRHKLIEVVPLRESRYLTLDFVMEHNREDFETCMISELTFLLNRRGKGGLYLYLKEKGFISSLSGTIVKVWNGSCTFGVSINVTIEGEKHIEEIILTFYEYIEFMKRIETSELRRIFEEKKQIEEVRFKFLSRGYPSGITLDLTRPTGLVEPKEILRYWAGCLYNFDLEDYRRRINCIKHEQMILMWESNKLREELEKPSDKDEEEEEDQSKPKFETEEIYGGRYRVSDVSPQMIEKIDDMIKNYDDPERERLQFDIPHKNEYVPENVDIVPFPNEEEKKKNKYPRLVFENEKIHVYYKQDTRFERPHAVYDMKLHISSVRESLKNNVCFGILMSLIREKLNETESYYAELAGHGFSLSPRRSGMVCHFSGWSDKLGRLARHVLNFITCFEEKFDPIRFLVLKEEMLKLYRNIKFGSPLGKAFADMRYSLCRNLYHYEEAIKVIEVLKLEDVKEYYKKVFLEDELRIDVLSVGNSRKENIIKEITDVFFKEGEQQQQQNKYNRLKPMDEEDIFYGPQCMKLLGKAPYILSLPNLNNEDKNNAAVIGFQCGKMDDKIDIITYFLRLAMSSDVFDFLRTKKQLGYNIGWKMSRLSRVYFAQFYVQSSDFSPVEISEKILQFLEEYYPVFKEKISKKEGEGEEDYFEKQLKVMITKYEEKPKNLNQEAGKYWGEIGTRCFRYERFNELVEIIKEKKFTKEDVLKFYETYFLGDERKMFQTHIWSHEKEEEREKEVLSNKDNERFTDDVNYFKDKMMTEDDQYYPNNIPF